jgi:hypothetical protein
MRRSSTPASIANFDSATAMLRALAHYLRGEDFANLGIWPKSFEPVLQGVGAGVDALPRRLQEQVYIWGGWGEAIRPHRLGSVRAERIADWMMSEYPKRRYPAAMIGSSNGALVHLGAALGIPWLPQTFLIPVRRSGIDPDEPKQDMHWAKEPARALLEANPELILHHMNDANQDRLMIHRMTYFRVKRTRLGAVYERFLAETLEPGATLFLVECGLKWPTVRLADRHIFQHGALGGATREEYLHGGPRVESYLERYGSHRRRWNSPKPDGDRPEAEWGFEPALRADIERFAQERGYRIRRIVFEQPEDLSPLVADLYRWWYRQRRLPANRLLVESFIMMEPWWAARTGSVPFWMIFNKEPSADALEKYLDGVEPFEDMYMMLFSHGVDSIGLVPIDRWRSILGRARRRGDFIGVDERAYPRDFATFVNYHAEFSKKIAARYPLPGPMALHQLDAFLDQRGDRYAVQWIDHPPAASSQPSGAPGTAEVAETAEKGTVLRSAS